MGYDDLKVIELRNFLRSIADGHAVRRHVVDAVRSAVALDALGGSVATGGWVSGL